MRGVILLCACLAVVAPPPMPALDAVDHLLLGVGDLDRGIAWVERATGVRAAVGGSHPGRGTRNALLSLGGRRYLEIIAPDPLQPESAKQTELQAIAEPMLIGWAAASTDLDALAANSRNSERQVVGPRDGSRVRPDGKLLRWRTLALPAPLERNGVDPIPFLIQWSADSVHPSQDSPGGCELQSFEIEHPDPAAVANALGHLGIEAVVSQAPAARLVATLKTPKGSVTLRQE